MIEYAAFYGSQQIFRYLIDKGAELTPSLWLYAIHGKNVELIHLLEYNDVEPTITVIKDYMEVEEKSYIECLNESIKCHHNDIANYFIDKYLEKEDGKSNELLIQSLKYYNFSFIQNECINETSFCHLCHYDYYLLAEFILTNMNIDINYRAIAFTEIKNHFFQ